jgi:hypothetical protein
MYSTGRFSLLVEIQAQKRVYLVRSNYNIVEFEKTATWYRLAPDLYLHRWSRLNITNI